MDFVRDQHIHEMLRVTGLNTHSVERACSIFSLSEPHQSCCRGLERREQPHAQSLATSSVGAEGQHRSSASQIHDHSLWPLLSEVCAPPYRWAHNQTRQLPRPPLHAAAGSRGRTNRRPAPRAARHSTNVPLGCSLLHTQSSSKRNAYILRCSQLPPHIVAKYHIVVSLDVCAHRATAFLSRPINA